MYVFAIASNGSGPVYFGLLVWLTVNFAPAVMLKSAAGAASTKEAVERAAIVVEKHLKCILWIEDPVLERAQDGMKNS